MKTVKSQRKHFRFLYQFLIKTGILTGMIGLILSFLICPFRMNDNTMFPSFRNGDLGIFCKIMSGTTNDVILYKDADNQLKVGRVVAVGGQTVEFYESGGFKINGSSIFDEVPYDTYATDVSIYPITLEDDQVFVLNDFRSVETDSRTFGPIDTSQIVGKLICSWRIRGF